MKAALSVRSVTSSDLIRTFEWANDELTRACSFNHDSIPFETHKTWFFDKLGNGKCYMYIVEASSKAIGIVRIEKQDSLTKIGIAVASAARGRGYSSDMLQLALKEYWKENCSPVYAYIKIGNTRSIRSFSRAGFVFDRMDTVDGIPCRVLRTDR